MTLILDSILIETVPIEKEVFLKTSLGPRLLGP